MLVVILWVSSALPKSYEVGGFGVERRSISSESEQWYFAICTTEIVKHFIKTLLFVADGGKEEYVYFTVFP